MIELTPEHKVYQSECLLFYSSALGGPLKYTRLNGASPQVTTGTTGTCELDFHGLCTMASVDWTIELLE